MHLYFNVGTLVGKS